MSRRDIQSNLIYFFSRFYTHLYVYLVSPFSLERQVLLLIRSVFSVAPPVPQPHLLSVRVAAGVVEGEEEESSSGPPEHDPKSDVVVVVSGVAIVPQQGDDDLFPEGYGVVEDDAEDLSVGTVKIRSPRSGEYYEGSDGKKKGRLH